MLLSLRWKGTLQDVYQNMIWFSEHHFLQLSLVLAPSLRLPILAWFDSPILVRLELTHLPHYSGVPGMPGQFVSKHNLVPYNLPSIQSREISGNFSGAFGGVGANYDLAVEARSICENSRLTSIANDNVLYLAPNFDTLWLFGQTNDLTETSVGEIIFPHHIVQMHEPSQSVVSQQHMVPIESNLSNQFQLWMVYTCTS